MMALMNLPIFPEETAFLVQLTHFLFEFSQDYVDDNAFSSREEVLCLLTDWLAMGIVTFL